MRMLDKNIRERILLNPSSFNSVITNIRKELCKYFEVDFNTYNEKVSKKDPSIKKKRKIKNNDLFVDHVLRVILVNATLSKTNVARLLDIDHTTVIYSIELTQDLKTLMPSFRNSLEKINSDYIIQMNVIRFKNILQRSRTSNENKLINYYATGRNIV